MAFACDVCKLAFASPLERRQHHRSAHAEPIPCASQPVTAPRLLELFELRIDHSCHVVRATPYEHAPPLGFIPTGYPVPIKSTQGVWSSMADCEGYLITLPDSTFAVSEWRLPRRLPHPMPPPRTANSPAAVAGVFIISLVRATERRHHVNTVLAPRLQQALPEAIVEVVDAVDGQKLSVQQLSSVAPREDHVHLVASSTSLPPGSTPTAACAGTEKWWCVFIPAKMAFNDWWVAGLWNVGH